MSKKELFVVIENYVSNLAAAPVQRSEEWYAIKRETIGGSEVATVIGKDKYKNAKDLALSKCGMSDFNGNVATRWGTILEEITKMWSEYLFNTHIYEAGSIEGCISGQRYSPDGIGVIKYNGKYRIVLFEFKSPLRTIPNGAIPEHYRPQVQTGLISIPITESAIFVNNCYRKCSLADVSFSLKYNNSFHQDYNTKFNTVYLCGVLCFESLESKDESYHDEMFEDDPSDNLSEISVLPIDYGAMSNCIMFDNFLERVTSGKIKTHYCPFVAINDAVKDLSIFGEYVKINKHLVYTDDSDNVNDLIVQQIENERSKYTLCGYMCYKLMKTDVIHDHAILNWKQLIEPPITKFLNNLKIVNAEPDKIKQKRLIDELF